MTDQFDPDDPTYKGWVNAIEGAALLDDVEKFLRRFIAFPSEDAAIAVALWAVHTHLAEECDSTPRLALLSPEPGSGKTRVLEVLELLTRSAMHVLSASPAAVFRTIASEPVTLLMDEADTIFGRRRGDDGSEDLRGLLNAGHRNGATIPRCVGPNHDVHRFEVFAPVALAGLGDLPETLMSRSVIIRMRRRRHGEKVEPFRHRQHAKAGHDLSRRIAEWAEAVAKTVSTAWPEMPEGVEDRPADVWESLLAVADAAGDRWAARSRQACSELVKVAERREASLGVRLLTDLRTVFEKAGGEAMFTETILQRLHTMEEAPWGDLHGKPLDARGLARRLRQYEVTSTKVKINGESLQGYRREHLWDTWNRYLSAPETATPEPAEPPEPCRSEATAEAPDDSQVPEPEQPRGTDPDPSDLQGSTGSGGSASAAWQLTEEQRAGLAGKPGRCSQCCHHVPTQGHHKQCPMQLEEIKR